VTACVPLAFCTLCASTHADLVECNTTRDWPLADQIPNTLLHTHERVMGTRTGHKRLLALPRSQDSSVDVVPPPAPLSLPSLPPFLPLFLTQRGHGRLELLLPKDTVHVCLLLVGRVVGVVVLSKTRREEGVSKRNKRGRRCLWRRWECG
jgi:hypothetical protein